MFELKQANNEISDALEWGFDLRLSSESIDTDWFSVKAREPFVAFGEDASGGVFLSGNVTGRVLYVSSEGQAGIVAISMSEFLQLIVTHPYWFDLLKFSGSGSLSEMQRSVPYLESEQEEDDKHEIAQAREAVSKGLAISKSPHALRQLQYAVSAGGVDIEVLAKDGTRFGSLFNKFTVESNLMWKQH
ncbi:hypothetical protein [Methylobacter sp.]|uniref:hypothetical protein n=1 Tax=Methylobacter sp. TaxID=2051955 RepID=UPI0012131C44|nr:hypothetical protein [Methylobacter sp.]TAK63042.1 MAG: hypothetical protein EPO18_08345 [Methylobacter sp.]